MLRIVFVPMHPEGRKFVIATTVLTVVLLWIWLPLAIVGICLTIGCYYFFRDLPRVVPQQNGVVVSPADGIISHVVSVAPPPELDLGTKEMVRISVFMNLFNCHINRAPVGGRIVNVSYRPGTFVNASLEKASNNNERNGIVIDHNGTLIGTVQIAGLVARRIFCFAQKANEIDIGERFGLIRFGSRLDVYLPRNAAIRVAVGQTAVAGETIVADLNSAATNFPASTV